MEDFNLVVEIPVWVSGTQKWVTGLTKRTTCDDVIYALLYNEGLHEMDNTDKYTIYERWRDVERPLQARTKILKIWRAWGAEQCNVQLTMRHIDEPSEYGEFLHSRRRRHRRTRHRDREGRRRSSRSRTNEGQSPSRMKNMEDLAKLVINQERKLHEIGGRIEKTDRNIDSFESTLHRFRMAQNGKDYVQDAYMNDPYRDDSMDEFLKNVNPENIEMYIEFCERVIELDGRIKNEHYKIEDLSGQIQDSFTERNNSVSNLDGSDSDLERELTNLQAELNRIVSANMMQKYKAVEITKEIDHCDKILKQKQGIIQDLQRQLESIESAESEAESFASARDYVNQSDESVSRDEGSKSGQSFTTSTPINSATLSRTGRLSGDSRVTSSQNNQSAKRKTNAESHSEYVNIGDIMSWNEQNESDDAFVECKEFQHATQVAKTTACTSAKKNSFDSEDSFSIDTDNTSNDSQFGGASSKDKYNNPLHHQSILKFPPNNRSLDSDDLISERIKSEIYAFKSPRKCRDLAKSLSNMNGDRSFSCNKSLDDIDSNSDTGLSSMNSDESPNFLETLV